MVKSLNGKRLLLEGLVLLLLFLLAKEWIYTLPSFTDTDVEVLWLFLWPFAILLLIHRVIPGRWIRVLVSLLFVLIWYERTLWPDVSLFSFTWVSGTYLMLKESGIDILRMNWIDIDPILRTGLFYLLIWVGVYLLHIRVLLKRKALGILLLSILYLSVLDTFLLFDGKWPVIKSLFYGFSLLAIFNLNRVEGLINRRVTQLNLTPWFMTGILVLFVVGSFGYLVPKGAANWPDPVSFITSLKGDGNAAGAGTATSGYGKDDRRLGGSFVMTDNVVLIGEVRGERYPSHYWRGESKDYYSGHGWDSQLTSNEPFTFLYENPHTLIDAPQHTRINESVTYTEPSRMFLASGQPLVVTPYAFEGIEANASVTATINPDTFSIQASHPFLHYETTSLIPKIPEDELIAISNQYANIARDYPQDIIELYTQLPEELPERIGELAGRVIGSEMNTYKQVKRIEYYLRWSGLQYRTNNIPYPEEGQDFVDQFLFDTRQGYCDHFSTSMVVMLRTQGIPARWVKGYSFGEMVSTSASTHEVTVRGKNAHSWVEVYFPEMGWIPFEPTASFNYPFEVLYATQEVESEPAAVITPQVNELLDEEKEKDQIKKNEAASAAAKSTLQKWTSVIVAGIVLMLGSLMAFFFREKIILHVQTLAIANDSGSNMVYRGYRVIMKWLARLIGVRAEHQTVREYTAELKMKDHQEELVELTRAFEETRYGEKDPSLTKGEFLEIWKRLLNKLRS